MTDAPRRHEGRTALVVDDDPAILDLVRRFLEQLGFAVDPAATGAEALAAIAGRGYDLVITDVSMPEMTGLEFLREARFRGMDAEVIVLTAVGSVSAAVEAMKSGAFEFLEKPVRFERLREVVEGAIDHRTSLARPVRTDEILEDVPLPTDGTGPTPGPADEPEMPTTVRPPPLPDPFLVAATAAAIGRYEIVSLVGRGGMGEVFRCRDPLIGRQVAVKVLRVASERPDRAAELVARFQREAAAAGALAHPGIVAVHDIGRDNRLGVWFIVLELVDGRGLDRVLEERRTLPVPEAVALAFQIADALAYAHARGIVHRDVKPSNVLVRPDASIKLLDFGLAAIQGSDLTLTGRVFGSPSYMAPERIRGKPGGPAADQFSLGVLLYETLAGENPFDGETPEARLVRVLREHPAPLDRRRPDVPEKLAAVVTRMVAKKEKDRFPTADDVVAALQGVGRTLGLRLERHAGPET